MDIVSFKEAFDPLLARHLAYKTDCYKKITKNQEILTLLQYAQEISEGGKRLRPFIVYSIYKTRNPQSQIEEILDLLLAIEIFHIFCLVHDDIMDEADTRHGKSTIHKYAEGILIKNNRINTKRVSEAQAILVGDILFNTVYELLYKNSWAKDGEIKSKIINIFTGLVDEVCVGQMIDINIVSKKDCSLEEIMEKTKLKTAYYSFTRPMEIGFALIGEEHSFTNEFGENIGILFQIQDDLLDIIGKQEETNKNTLSDVLKNQHTLLTDYINNKAEARYRESLKNIENLNEGEIINLFVQSGAINHAKQIIEDYNKKCISIIENSDIREGDKNIFKYLTSLLQNRTK